MRVNTLPLVHLAGLVLVATACGNPAPPSAASPPVITPTPAKAASPAASPATPVTLAQLREDVPFPLTRILGRPVAEVQAELGEALGKGMARESCVRYVPARTFFGCHYTLQSYADRTGNFAAVQVGYEDGVATEVAYDGWKSGTGAFTPEALLTAVGLTLPEAGKQSAPAENVRLWSWFNSQARLKIAGKQYRVEVSIVGDDWARSRVQVLQNDPLTPEQQAKTRELGPLISESP